MSNLFPCYFFCLDQFVNVVASRSVAVDSDVDRCLRWSSLQGILVTASLWRFLAPMCLLILIMVISHDKLHSKIDFGGFGIQAVQLVLDFP